MHVQHIACLVPKDLHEAVAALDLRLLSAVRAASVAEQVQVRSAAVAARLAR